MKIWIDLANAPHVNFFLPIIKILSHKNHELLVTLRNFNQAVELAHKYEIKGLIIGKHGGKGRFKKLPNLVYRSIKLARVTKGKDIDIAVSHNSYSQIITGRLVGSRVITLMDYEGQPANHLAFRLADKIIVPESFPDQALKRFGAGFRKVYKYKGYKEQVYLSDFIPDKLFYKEIIDACNLNADYDFTKTVLVTIRTPPTMASYHLFENKLFNKLLLQLNRVSKLTVIALPRNSKQREEIAAKFPNLKVPKFPMDGRNLVCYSDLVISAGGTMNREAAILGTPAYTIFSGSIPAVDASLVKMGRMIRLSRENDLSKIQFIKKKRSDVMRNPDLCKEIIYEIITC